MRYIFVFLWITLTMFVSDASASEKLTRNQVYEIQQKLNLLGFSSGTPDGLAGKKTRRAVSAFQTKYGLEKQEAYNTNLLDDVRNIYLDEAELVFENLAENEFLRSGLAQVKIPDNYEFFIDDQKLKEFHDAYGVFVEPHTTLTMTAWDLPKYFDDCERAIGEFDTRWNKLEIQQRFIRCLTAFTHIHFNRPNEGIEIFENILRTWSKLRPVYYRGKTKLDEYNQDYAAVEVVAGIAQFYAVYYETFSFSEQERVAVDNYLRAWLITEDVFPNTGYGKCNLSRMEDDFKREITNFDADYCGSNRWRMALGATYLGLRLNDALLFQAGNRHLFWATSAIDRKGIYMPWAHKGALALSYQRQLPEVLTFLADAYESVGFDFYNYKTSNGATIAKVYYKFFEFIDDPMMLDNYARSAPNFAGKDYEKFKKLPLGVQQSKQQIHHEILEVQSETFLLRHAGKIPSIHLVDNWDTNWKDYIGVFVPTSGVAVTYARNKIDQASNNSTSLPKMDRNLDDRGDYSLKCAVKITRSLNGNNNLIGEGIVIIEEGKGRITDFEPGIGFNRSRFITTKSDFVFDTAGSLKGALTLHTMFTSEAIDLVPFRGTSVLLNKGIPEGDHYAKLYNYEINVRILNCQDLHETRKMPSIGEDTSPDATSHLITEQQLADKGDYFLQCGITITRFLNDESHVLGSGNVLIEAGVGKIDNFEWNISGLEESDFIETKSNFVFSPNGALIGTLAIHTMFGSERLDLVPFMGTSALSFKGFPEGAHIARIYDFELQTSVSNCKDSPKVKEANYSTLKITWHSELRDEGYRVSFEALDVIKYSEDFSELEISHEYFSDSGIKGRDKLAYTLKGENLQIEGAINFYDDLINISINVPIMQREHTVVFGTNDKLVLSW